MDREPLDLTSLHATVQAWDGAAASDDLLPYYRVWTHSPVLDAVYMARVALRNLDEIAQLRAFDTGALNRRFFELPTTLDSRQQPDPLLVLSQWYLNDVGQPVIHQQDECSLYSVDVALRLIRDALRARRVPSSDPKIKELLRICAEFVGRATETSAVQPQPAVQYGPPAIFGAFAATSSLYSLALIQRETDLSVREHLAPDSFVRMVDGVLQSDFTWQPEDGRSFAFKRPSSSQGCLTTTQFVYRIRELLSDGILGEEAHEASVLLNRALRSKRHAVLEFARDCYDRESGGFRSTPGAPIASIPETRYGLQLLCSMLEREEIFADEVTDWFDPIRTLRFVNASWTNTPVAGYRVVPSKHVVPAVCSVRSALSVVKLMELMRIVGDFKQLKKDQYQEQISRLVSRTADVRRFVADCSDSEGRYFAFPTSALNGWRTAEKSAISDAYSDDIGPFYSALAKSYSGGEEAGYGYVVSRKAQEFEISRSLVADLTELSIRNGHLTPGRAFGETRSLISRWSTPPLRLQGLGDEEIRELVDRGFVEPAADSGMWRLKISPDAVPAALAWDRNERANEQLIYAARAFVDDDIAVLPSPEAVIEEGRQLAEFGRQELHVFSCDPWVLLPDVSYSDPTEFEERFGWKLPRATPPVSPRTYLGYKEALLAAARRREVSYCWDRSAAAERLRFVYERAPHDKRLTYTFEAARSVASALRAELRLSSYRSSEGDEAIYDWRRWVAYLTKDRIVLAFRVRRGRIESGLRLSPSFFERVVQQVVAPTLNRPLTPFGAALVERWWWREDRTLLSLLDDDEAVRSTVPIVVMKGESLDERAREAVLAHLKEGAVYGTAKRAVETRAARAREEDRVIERWSLTESERGSMSAEDVRQFRHELADSLVDVGSLSEIIVRSRQMVRGDGAGRGSD